MTTAVRFLLDTPACLFLIRSGLDAGGGALRDLFARSTPGEVGISSLTLAALRARAQASRAPAQNAAALEQFVLPLAVVDFDAAAAGFLATLAAAAETHGYAAGPQEMVAAQALRLDATLVTSRPDLYAAVPALRLLPLQALPPAPLPPAPETIRLAGSHDFSLDLLAAWLQRGTPPRTLAIESVGSLRGLLALAGGTADAAPAHLLDAETGEYNRSYIEHLLAPLGVHVVLLGFVERQQGLIVRKGNPLGITSPADLARPDVRLVNRQRGAGTRVLLEYHLRRLGIAPESVRGADHEEPTHLAVAAAVADGRADCGLGVPHAAASLGLDFVPLFAERFDLVIRRDAYAGETLRPLVALLAARTQGFVAAVEALGGYTTQGMGLVLGEW